MRRRAGRKETLASRRSLIKTMRSGAPSADRNPEGAPDKTGGRQGGQNIEGLNDKDNETG